MICYAVVFRQRRKFVQQLAGCMADVMAASAAAMLESASLFLHPDLVESVKFSVPAPCSGPPFSRPDDQDTPARLSLQPQPGSCKPTAGTLPDMLPSKQHLPDVNGKVKLNATAIIQSYNSQGILPCISPLAALHTSQMARHCHDHGTRWPDHCCMLTHAGGCAEMELQSIGTSCAGPCSVAVQLQDV